MYTCCQPYKPIQALAMVVTQVCTLSFHSLASLADFYQSSPSLISWLNDGFHSLADLVKALERIDYPVIIPIRGPCMLSPPHPLLQRVCVCVCWGVGESVCVCVCVCVWCVWCVCQVGCSGRRERHACLGLPQGLVLNTFNTPLINCSLGAALLGRKC